MALVLVHIGMMKAASTWLHTWLSAHPELSVPWPTHDIAPGKNPYFWNKDHPFGRPPSKIDKPPPVPTLEEYLRLAESAPKVFDLTDSYSYMTAGQISFLKAEYPDALISYTIREPVDAAWAHMLGHRMTIEDLERGNKAGPRVLANAQVEKNLARWWAAGFDPHIIRFEQIQRDPLLVLRGLACRLGINPHWWTPRAGEVRAKIHERRRPDELTPQIRARLKTMIKEYADGS